MDVLQDLGLVTNGPEGELTEVNSKNPTYYVNDVKNGPWDKKDTMGSNLMLGPDVTKWALVSFTSTDRRSSQNAILDPCVPPGFEHVVDPRGTSIIDSDYKFEQDYSSSEVEGSAASDSSPSDNDQEAEATWEVGKELGLSIGIDSVAVQVIIEEMVERKQGA